MQISETSSNGLASALRVIGERESGTAHLEEAVVTYREALSEKTRERTPLDFAGMQFHLGNTLLMIGQRTNSITRLEEAVVAYRNAISVYEPAQSIYLPIAQGQLWVCESLLAARRNAPTWPEATGSTK